MTYAGAGAGSYFMDLSNGSLRTVDSSAHLYLVTEGKALTYAHVCSRVLTYADVC